MHLSQFNNAIRTTENYDAVFKGLTSLTSHLARIYFYLTIYFTLCLLGTVENRLSFSGTHCRDPLIRATLVRGTFGVHSSSVTSDKFQV